MRHSIKVGVIQTVLDSDAAWANGPKMSDVEAAQAINEIALGFRSLRDDGHQPDIVLLPELAIPREYLQRVVAAADHMRAIVIGGVDYAYDQTARGYKNEAVVIVPRVLGDQRIARVPYLRFVRKCYPAPFEAATFKKMKQKFVAGSAVPIFDAGPLGVFAIAICYDLTDVQRLALYRPHIHHLFVLAYNKDLTSFNHMAEAAARMNFANVVICNTGFFGGSLAIAPYYEPYRRQIFGATGPKLFTAQAFDLEVDSLASHQKGKSNKIWKSLPPGFDGNKSLTLQVKNVMAK